MIFGYLREKLGYFQAFLLNVRVDSRREKREFAALLRIFCAWLKTLSNLPLPLPSPEQKYSRSTFDPRPDKFRLYA